MLIKYTTTYHNELLILVYDFLATGKSVTLFKPQFLFCKALIKIPTWLPPIIFLWTFEKILWGNSWFPDKARSPSVYPLGGTVGAAWSHPWVLALNCQLDWLKIVCGASVLPEHHFWSTPQKHVRTNRKR